MLFMEPLENRRLLATVPIIVDNLDPINFIKTGAWNTASGTGYAGSIFWSNLPHDGSETAAWTFNVDPGTYRVAGTWHGANPAHGSNVPISVLSGTVQIGTTTLNQSISPDDFYESGAWWENIGTFTVGSTLRVQLTDNANGYAIADAFRIEKVATAVIVDNLDPINFAKSGAWNLASGAGLGYAGSIYWSNLPHDGSETATWTFNVDPGTYRISGTWHSANPSHGSDVPISVLSGSIPVGAATLNQKLSPDDYFQNNIWWENIGLFTVDSTLRIQLSDKANGYAIADAFRVERVISASPVAQDNTAYFTPTGTDLVISTSSVPPPVVANDVALDSPTVWTKVVTYPTNGTLIAFGTDGTFTYRPNSGFTGVDSFNYRTSNGAIESLPARVSIAVGTRLLGRQNLDNNVLNPWADDPWLATSLLDATTPSEGFGQGYSNIPMGSSGETEGGIAATGGLQLAEDVAPNTAIVYRSNSLTKPIVSLHSQLATGVAVPAAITARLIFNGVAGPVTSYSTAGILAGQAKRFAFQADGTSLPTGIYDYTIEVATTVNGIALTQSFSGKQAIVNRSASEFGFGWGLDGLDRLFDSTSGALIVRGNGDSLWFPKSGTSYQHALGDISYSTLVKNGNGTFTLTSKTGIVSGFSSLGLLTSRLDSNNNTIAYTYADRNSDGIAAELISITDPFGRITNFNYTSGKVTSIAHFSGRTTSLSYSGSNLSGYTLTDPDGPGPLTSPAITFGYDTSTLTFRTNALSETTSFMFDSMDSRLRSVLTPDNATWQIAPSETIGLPTGVSGNTLAKPIDVQATITDQRNNVWKFRTDRFGGITESITALGYIRTAQRNADGLPYVNIDPDPDGSGPLNSPVTFVGYNASADLTYLVAPDGGVTKMDYSQTLHRPMSVVDPVGRSQNFFYGSTGNMLTSVDGGGFVTSIVYNSRGLATSVTEPDPDGIGPLAAPVTGLAYDSFGRLISVTNPDNSTQSFTYNSDDQILTTVDELTKTTSFVYDLLGRTISSTNRVNATTQWTHDALR